MTVIRYLLAYLVLVVVALAAVRRISRYNAEKWGQLMSKAGKEGMRRHGGARLGRAWHGEARHGSARYGAGLINPSERGRRE